MNQRITYVICQKDILNKEKKSKDVVADDQNEELHRREDKTVWCLVGAITGVFTNTHTHRKSKLTATVYPPHQLRENRCVTLNSAMCVYMRR